VGGCQESVPWRGAAEEGQTEERGWAYRRRLPEGTVLYEEVRDHLATLLAAASDVGHGLLRYVAADGAAGGEPVVGARARGAAQEADAP
jgi:hypothetical protein